MVQHRGLAPLAVDLQSDPAPAHEFADIAAQQPAQMQNHTVMLARVSDFEQSAACGFDNTAIADLPAAFGIEGSLRGYDRDSVTIRMSSYDLRVDLEPIIKKPRRRARTDYNFRRAFVLAGGPRALALLLHQAIEFV
jgi:hypothetical protein